MEINWNVLTEAGADNNDGNSNNIIFTIKDTELYIPVVTLSTRVNIVNRLFVLVF